MGVKEAVVERLREILDQRDTPPNGPAYRSGLTHSTVYMLENGAEKRPSI